MTNYVLEFFNRGSKHPDIIEEGSLRWGHHPRFTNSEACFDYRLAKWNGKVKVRYACNGNLAAETYGKNRLRWVKH